MSLCTDIATDIPSFEEKAKDALAQSEMEFKAHFIFRMREAIESAGHEFRELNYSLDQFQFHKDKYSFLITPGAKYKPFYDAVMSVDWEIAGGLYYEKKILTLLLKKWRLTFCHPPS